MRIRAFSLAVAVFAALPISAEAQSRLDRMEALSVQLGGLMNEVFLLEAPQLADVMPDPAWDGPMRDAHRCMLDAYETEVGGAAVDDMLDQMEQIVPTLTAQGLLDEGMEIDVGTPPGMSDDRAQAIVRECGIIELTMQRMQESGMMEAMMGLADDP